MNLKQIEQLQDKCCEYLTRKYPTKFSVRKAYGFFAYTGGSKVIVYTEEDPIQFSDCECSDVKAWFVPSEIVDRILKEINNDYTKHREGLYK